MMDPKGKTVVITGAASGLGRAWSEGFNNEGALVIAADIDERGLASLAKGIKPVVTDVSSKEDVFSLIDYAVEQTGKIDILFNNAGYGLPYKLEDYPSGEFEKLVAVHLFGTVYGMQAAIPVMRKQGFGRIINTISRHAETSAPKASAYAASKAAIWTVSRSTAEEVHGSGILVNMLIPGPTNTGIWGKDMPQLQAAEVTFPTAKMLALCDDDGPSGRIFWDEKEYQLFGNIYS